MTDMIALLSLSPEEGLKSILQTTLKPGLKADYFKFGTPVAIDGKLTSIHISIDRANAPVNYWRWSGSIDFEFNRYSLNEVFGSITPDIRVTFPTDIQGVMEAITKKLGIAFDSNDLEPVWLDYDEGPSYVMVAKPESKRWIGSVPLPIRPIYQSLSIAFANNELLGLRYNEDGFHSSTPTLQRLLDELNNSQETNLHRGLRLNEVAFSAPVKLSDNDIEGNTRVTLSITNSDLYKGTLDITYQRQYMPRVCSYSPVDVTGSGIMTHRDLAIAAANVLGIYLDPTDVIEDAVPYVSVGDTVTVTIQLDPQSYSYTGDLTVDYTRI